MSEEHQQIRALPIKIKILIKIIVYLLNRLDNLLEPFDMNVVMSILGTEKEPEVIAEERQLQ